MSTTVGSGSLVLPEPVRVNEPCPQSTPFQPAGDGSAMLEEASRLEPMLGVVVAYGGERPDEFGSYGLIWHGDGDASVVISFTGRLNEHRSALGGRVEFPDELVVCQVALPGQASEALAGALADDLAGRFQSIGRGIGPVDVVLNAGEDVLADQLVSEYGDAVHVTVCRDVADCAIGEDETDR